MDFRKLKLVDFIIGILLLGIFALGFFISYELFKISKVYKPLPTTTSVSYTDVSPAPINNNTQKKGVYNILFLGYGGAGHEGSLLTDSIIVVHIDINNNKTTLISVPRDLWVNGNHKINASGLSGFQNISPVIEEVTGLPINYYVSVDFGGFVKIIDGLGGINVDVPKTFDDPYYPITGQENNTCGKTEDEINSLKAKYSGYQLETQFTCRYEHLHFDKGPETLDGTTALKFVRSRHGDSDFGRSERQFAVLVGIEKKLINLQNIGKIDQTVDTFSKIVKTDMDIGVIKSMIAMFQNPAGYQIGQIHLTTDNVLSEGKASDGEYILFPKSGMFNFDDIKNFIDANL